MELTLTDPVMYTPPKGEGGVFIAPFCRSSCRVDFQKMNFKPNWICREVVTCVAESAQRRKNKALRVEIAVGSPKMMELVVRPGDTLATSDINDINALEHSALNNTGNRARTGDLCRHNY